MPVLELESKIKEAFRTKRVFKGQGVEYFTNNIPLVLLEKWSDRPRIPNMNFPLSPINRARLDLLHRDTWVEETQKDYLLFKKALTKSHPSSYLARLSLFPTAGQGGTIWQYELGTEEDRLRIYQSMLYPDLTNGKVSRRKVSRNTEQSFDLFIQYALNTS